MSAQTVNSDPVQAQDKTKKKKNKSKIRSDASSQPDKVEAQVNGSGNTHKSAELDPDTPMDQDHIAEDQEAEYSGDDAPEHINGTAEQRKTSADTEPSSSAATARLDAAAKERDDLRLQVTELRQELESIQKRHEQEISQNRQSLQDAQVGKEHAENRYNKLLGQVNTIKTQLGERLKADAAELAQCREQIESLEEENRSSKDDQAGLQSQVDKLNSQNEEQEREISSLRSRSNLSQQNWAKERDEMVQRQAQLQEEFESAKQAMQDWEVLATEERSLREGLHDRVLEIEEQLSNQQELYNRAVSERDDQSVTVDGLQRALEEVHAARKKERRELVESSELQLEELRKALKTAEQVSSSAQLELSGTKQELERALPFEKEVKEKNLLIGKLRHEAVILNDHLTKALRFLKRGKPEDNVDRQLITNHFIHFLALERADPKKFQVLQLIAALLGWTDEQKEAAGLARPGASTSTNLRVPLSSPFRRVSSTASLNPLPNSGPMSPPLSSSQFGSLDSPSGKETLAELWSDFLEREAEQGSTSGGTPRPSRRGSAVGAPSPLPLRSGVVGPPMSGSPVSPQGRKNRDNSIAEEALD